MKLIFISFIISVASCADLSAQKITIKDLLGVWKKDSVEGKRFTTVLFKDSTQVIFYDEKGYSKAMYRIADTLDDKTLLLIAGKRFYGYTPGRVFTKKQYIEIAHSDTLRIKEFYPGKFTETFIRSK